MANLYKIIFPLFLACITTACSDNLDDGSVIETEKINGFDVKWRKYTKDSQKQVARDILENMIFVKGGTFMMGATPNQYYDALPNEYPNHPVSVSDFYMCCNEITPEQFYSLLDSSLDNSYNKNSFNKDDFVTFFKTLSEITSIEFDFPTEAQWEYAAKGGGNPKDYLYPGTNDLDEANSFDKEQGSTEPNSLGFYNLSDLRAEICKDYYQSYTNQFAEDPCATSGKYNTVVRGGSYNCSATASNYGKLSNYSYGYYHKSLEFDTRYCRVTARSYTYNRKSLYLTSRAVINIKK